MNRRAREQRRRDSRLEAVSEQLWSYDVKRHKGWQLDTDGERRRLPRGEPRRGGGAVVERQQEKLRHYIGAGAMRHENGELRERRAASSTNPAFVWRIFAAAVLIWWLCRLLPLGSPGSAPAPSGPPGSAPAASVSHPR